MNDRIFIHFLNRELYRSIGISNLWGASNAIKMLLFGTSAELYVPLSSLWESFGITDIDYDIIKQLYDLDQIEIISDCLSLPEFLERNQALYKFDYGRYSDIYTQKKRQLITVSPTVIKRVSATESISREINRWNEGVILPRNLLIDQSVLLNNKDSIVRANQTREERALTMSLFSTDKFSLNARFSIARMLSTFYILGYLENVGADIATGVNKSIVFYDTIARSFPYYDISVIETILMVSGIKESFIKYSSSNFWKTLIERRRRGDLADIHFAIKEIIQQCYIGCKQNENQRIIRERIIKQLYYISEKLRFAAVIDLFKKVHYDRLYSNLNVLLKSLKDTEIHYDDRIFGRLNSTIGNYRYLLRGGSLMRKIFISHSSLDERYVTSIVKLIESLGIDEKQLVCTSVAGYGVPLNEDIYEYLRSQFEKYELHVIFVLSDNYYNSVASLNEMGAAWALQKEYTCFLVPGFSFKAIKGAINIKQNSIDLSGKEIIVSDLLNQLKDLIISEFGLPRISEIKWERCKKEFFESIKNP